MLQCIIVDDERSAIDVLALYFDKVPFLELVHATTNPFEGISLINEGLVDLAFLDIQMPDMSGIEFIKTIQGKCKVILTTASPEHAIEGYQLDVVDYLLKPISVPRFIQAVQKAHNIISQQSAAKTDTYVEDDHIYVKTESKGKLLKIYFSEISYIESVKNYVAIHHGSEKTLVLIAMKDLEDILPNPGFKRIHRSFIIATNKIRSIEANAVYLKGVALAIPFGEAFKADFIEQIKNRLI